MPLSLSGRTQITRQRSTALLLVFFLLLSGCNLGVPENPVDVDWCYRLDFTESDFDATITEGFWTDGLGFYDDELGHLSFSFTVDHDVQPSYVTLFAARGAAGDFNVAGTGLVFGISAEVSETFPALLDEVPLTFNTTDPTDHGVLATINLETTNTLYIEAFEVGGLGVNPFGVSNCGSAPTTEPPSQTPTQTLTPSLTPSWSPTPSQTLTPSVTPTIDPCSFLPIPQGDGTFALVVTFDCPSGLEYDITFGSVTSGVGLSGSNALYDTDSVAATVGIIIHVDPSWTIYGWGGETKVVFGGSDTGKAVYTQYHPVGGSWSGLFEVADPGVGSYVGRFNGSTISGVDMVEVIVQANSDVSVESFLDNAFIRFTGTYNTPTSTPTGSPTLGTPSPSPTLTLNPATQTRTATITPIFVGTHTQTVTPSPSLSVTPPASTAVPSATRTGIPIATSYPTPDPGDCPPEGCDPSVPVLIGIGEAINDFFGWLVNTALNFFDWIGGLIGWFFGSLANLWALLLNFFNAILEFIRWILALFRELLDIIALLLAIIQHVLYLFGLWIGQFIETGRAMINAWITATPLAIPGLPACVSAPTGSQVCAVYYVLQYTILSGTLGSAILLVMVILIDLSSVFYFLRRVRNLILKIQGLSQ